jgi:hypothetical protein
MLSLYVVCLLIVSLSALDPSSQIRVFVSTGTNDRWWGVVWFVCRSPRACLVLE